MRKSLYGLCVVVCVFGLSACNPSITFDVDIAGSGTIKAGGLLDKLLEDFGLGEFQNVDFSTTQEFKNNDVRREHVTKASLVSLQFKIESPADQNFDFLEKVEFYVEAPGLDKVLVASKTVPKGSKEFSFDVNAVDLGPYIRKERVSFTTEATGRNPTEDTKIQVSAKFSVTASLFKEKS